MPLEPTSFTLLAALLGLLVGSFLNVVIHRLPRMMEREWQQQCAELNGLAASPDATPYNLATPGSHCPACGQPVAARDNIPVVGYLLLRGRCRHCAARISPRYPLVELLSAALSALVAAHFGPGWTAIAGLLLVWTLIALSFIDLDTQLLPDAMTQPLLWAGLLINLAHTFTDLQSAVIGAAAGYLFLWGVYWLHRLVTGREGMGYGDFKLLAALGAWFGWQMLPAIVVLSSMLGAIVGIALIVLARHGRNVPIPFGPYLAIAGLAALLWGREINRFYLGIMA